MPESRRGLTSLTIAGVRLSRRGWGFLASSAILFIAAYSSGRHELLYAASLLLILPVVAAVIVRVRRPRLAVTRTFSPHVIQAGTTADVAITVRNLATGRSMRARWWDGLPWAPHATEGGLLATLEPRSPRFRTRGNSTSMHYELQPPRRGRFEIGPLGIEVGDGFGLATSATTVGTEDAIIVTPEVVPLAESGLSVPAGDGEARLLQRRAAGDEDDTMTREYRRGDAMRRVHWRASARHGDLMVRQEEQRSFPEATIFVETQYSGYPDAWAEEADAESPAFEWTVRMLASVAVHLRRTGFLVTIVETGTPQLTDVGGGRSRTWGDEEILTTLASLELTDHANDDVRAAKAGAGPLIALLGNPQEETLDALIARRRPGELAVAFMVVSASPLDVFDRSFGTPAVAPHVAERLTDAGWLVVPVRSDDDHSSAWSAVVVETGRARGH